VTGGIGQNLERCLADVCAVSGILILQSAWLCHGIRAVAVSEVAGLLPARPRAPNGRGRACRRSGPAYWAATRLGGRESWFEAGCTTKYSTSLSIPTHHAHIQTSTHTQTLRVAQWAHLCGLGAVA